MRALVLTLFGIILIIIVVSSYNWWKIKNDEISPIAPSLKLIGVIDMDRNHGVSVAGVKSGDDVLVVLDYASFTNEFVPAHPELKDYYSSSFDLIYYDTNHSGEIDNEEPIWNYLYIVVYSDDGSSYQVRRLNDAGIHAIIASHLTAHGNHMVLLSDGDTRTLYETRSVGTPQPPLQP